MRMKVVRRFRPIVWVAIYLVAIGLMVVPSLLLFNDLGSLWLDRPIRLLIPFLGIR
jgi:hypothetical protein